MTVATLISREIRVAGSYKLWLEFKRLKVPRRRGYLESKIAMQSTRDRVVVCALRRARVVRRRVATRKSRRQRDAVLFRNQLFCPQRSRTLINGAFGPIK